MTLDDDTYITWGDLKEETLQALFAKWTRQVIRKCFLTFLPVLIMLGGSFISIATWYLNDIRADIKQIAISQDDHKNQINSIVIKLNQLQNRTEDW